MRRGLESRCDTPGAKLPPPMIFLNWKFTAPGSGDGLPVAGVPPPAPRSGTNMVPPALGSRFRRSSFAPYHSALMTFTPVRDIPKRASLTSVGDSVDVKLTARTCGFFQV